MPERLVKVQLMTLLMKVNWFCLAFVRGRGEDFCVISVYSKRHAWTEDRRIDSMPFLRFTSWN